MDMFVAGLLGVLAIGAIGTGLIVVAAYTQHSRRADRPENEAPTS